MGILKTPPVGLLELCHTLAQNLQCLSSTLEFRLARSFKIWHLQVSLASSSQQISCSFSCLPLHVLFLPLEELPSFLLCCSSVAGSESSVLSDPYPSIPAKGGLLPL